LRLFGSVSRDEQHEGSDVDVCVDMEPQAYLMVRLKRFLEQLLGCPVDVIRMHKHINPYLLQEIEQDGIYVIR
jgi:predicted nucleotidyltransferase